METLGKVIAGAAVVGAALFIRNRFKKAAANRAAKSDVLDGVKQAVESAEEIRVKANNGQVHVFGPEGKRVFDMDEYMNATIRR